MDQSPTPTIDGANPVNGAILATPWACGGRLPGSSAWRRSRGSSAGSRPCGRRTSPCEFTCESWSTCSCSQAMTGPHRRRLRADNGHPA